MENSVLGPWRDVAIVLLVIETAVVVAIPGVVFISRFEVCAVKRRIVMPLLTAALGGANPECNAARISAAIALPIASQSAEARIRATAQGRREAGDTIGAIMEQRFDSAAMIERAREIRQGIRESEAYPAIIGGIAGGIAGALMATIIASRFAPRSEPQSYPQTAAGRGGFATRDMVQLLGVIAGLVKQVREWYYQEKARR
jgi:hypothetical protein